MTFVVSMINEPQIGLFDRWKKVRMKVPVRMKIAVQDCIETDKWKLPLFVQLSSLPTAFVPLCEYLLLAVLGNVRKQL